MSEPESNSAKTEFINREADRQRAKKTGARGLLFSFLGALLGILLMNIPALSASLILVSFPTMPICLIAAIRGEWPLNKNRDQYRGPCPYCNRVIVVDKTPMRAALCYFCLSKVIIRDDQFVKKY